ncbi:MAG: nuclear transport factor 2 family protein [Pseudomonadota bacterium]
MRTAFFIFAAVVTSVFGAAHAGDKSADKAVIETVIQDYFDGIGAADRERLERAFAADKAVMVGLGKSGPDTREHYAYTDMNAVIDNWVANKTPEGTGRDGEILDMWVRDGIAGVFFRYKDEYYDIRTLLKVEGEWKIATKTYYER